MAQPGLLLLPWPRFRGGGIPTWHKKLPLNPQPAHSAAPTSQTPHSRQGPGRGGKQMGFATYWCPPQASARLGAGSPGGWVAPAPGPGAQRGLGSGSERPGDGSCLPCLSLSMGEETRPGRWGAKNASASKTRDPVNVNQKEKKDEKIKKRIENCGEKDGGRAIQWLRGRAAFGLGTGAGAAGTGTSAEHGAPRLRGRLGVKSVAGVSKAGSSASWSEEGTGHTGKAGQGGSGAAHGRSSEGRWGSLGVAL